MAGTIVAGTLSDGTYSGSVTDTVRGACKAWVNFNGTGTVAIRAAYNVSSITDNGTGNYLVNFTTAMPDVNYCVSVDGSYNSSYEARTVDDATYTTSATGVLCYVNNGGVIADVARVSVSVFR